MSVALAIERYALIGDMQTGALVGDDASVDWLCVPRFDSDACFAALLGTAEHGRWALSPPAPPRRTRRAYREGTLVLDTELELDDGTVRVTDFMPPRAVDPVLVRIVECTRGRAELEMTLAPRFGYGRQAPWVRLVPGGATMVAGPDALALATPARISAARDHVHGRLRLVQGERTTFTLAWRRSYEAARPAPEPLRALGETEAFWRRWSARCTFEGPHRDAVLRSLVTLKALTFAPSGGIVAAPTTSLPEALGGVRNWDYRFCWVRDATFTLFSLVLAGYVDEARAWREWLLRAAAGDPAQLQIMYGVDGERRLTERELPWLPGYQGARPVRIGNAASEQLQLDVFGELLDALHQAHRAGVPPSADDWALETALLEHLEKIWREPDQGIWERRSAPAPLTHSKVMAWVAFDRAVSSVERMGLPGPAARWRRLRDEIHAEVCARGFDRARNSFVQAYGSTELDASLLLVPLVGFLPPDDPRVRGTVDAITRELVEDGLVVRYRSERASDGLPPGEGVFLPCSFWLADCLGLLGRHDEANRLFHRLLALRNDVGLLSEEYDPRARRLVGNFPQAFSHVALVNAARNLERPGGPAQRRHRA